MRFPTGGNFWLGNVFLNAKSSPRAQADVVRFHNRQYSLDGRRRKNGFVCSDEFIDELQPLAQKSEGELLGYKK